MVVAIQLNSNSISFSLSREACLNHTTLATRELMPTKWTHHLNHSQGREVPAKMWEVVQIMQLSCKVRIPALSSNTYKVQHHNNPSTKSLRKNSRIIELFFNYSSRLYNIFNYKSLLSNS